MVEEVCHRLGTEGAPVVIVWRTCRMQRYCTQQICIKCQHARTQALGLQRTAQVAFFQGTPWRRAKRQPALYATLCVGVNDSVHMEQQTT